MVRYGFKFKKKGQAAKAMAGSTSEDKFTERMMEEAFPKKHDDPKMETNEIGELVRKDGYPINRSELGHPASKQQPGMGAFGAAQETSDDFKRREGELEILRQERFQILDLLLKSKDSVVLENALGYLINNRMEVMNRMDPMRVDHWLGIVEFLERDGQLFEESMGIPPDRDMQIKAILDILKKILLRQINIVNSTPPGNYKKLIIDEEMFDAILDLIQKYQLIRRNIGIIDINHEYNGLVLESLILDLPYMVKSNIIGIIEGFSDIISTEQVRSDQYYGIIDGIIEQLIQEGKFLSDHLDARKPADIKFMHKIAGMKNSPLLRLGVIHLEGGANRVRPRRRRTKRNKKSKKNKSIKSKRRTNRKSNKKSKRKNTKRKIQNAKIQNAKKIYC